MDHDYIQLDLVNQENDKLHLSLTFDERLEYFNGHFTDFKLLPALIQVKLVTEYCESYMGVKCEVMNIPNMKFLKPICPGRNVELTLELVKEQSRLNFKYFVGDSIYSSGTLKI